MGVRPVDIPRDKDGLLRLDTSFVSTQVFHARTGAAGELSLAAEAAGAPVEKRFELKLDAGDWTDGWVVDEQGEESDDESGQIRGFVACEYSAWNRRWVIRHFYVDAPHRGRGLGRQLMEAALARGRELGAVTAWVETSNLNYPGVLAYRSLGFELCGFDLTLYRGTAHDDEFASFLAREL
jgi:ribosomal protein S18 acetylase RimI-like enzyme